MGKDEETEFKKPELLKETEELIKIFGHRSFLGLHFVSVREGIACHVIARSEARATWQSE